MPLLNGECDNERSHPVGKTYVWPYASDVHCAVERPAFPSTHEYVRAALETFTGPEDATDCAGGDDEDRGVRKILDIVFAHPVFNSQQDETFVLQHEDLDLQNILTDAEGNVTGIIDWDGYLAMPRCVGHAAVPNFLRRDWFPGTVTRRPHMSFQTEYYREVYAAAMVKAGNPDAIYTLKSPIYQAAFAALYEGGSCSDFVEKFLRSIPKFLASVPFWVAMLGSLEGHTDLEALMTYRLNKVIKLELPSVTWQEVEADLAAWEWMTDVQGLVEPDMESA